MSSTMYDREQVSRVREATKEMARHVCTVEHPVFGYYKWLQEWFIYSDLLEMMLHDALGLLEAQMGEDDE